MKKAIVAGLGGIGKNVYVPQLEKHGFAVDTVDINPDSGATYATVNDVPKDNQYDLAAICLPNIHHLNAVLELSDVTKRILVEKPGLANTDAWRGTIDRFPNHRIVMVKNNLYRKNIDKLSTMCDLEAVDKVEIRWFNKDRIPNPGSWFTNRQLAFGGVTHDLFPHLYCFMFALFPLFLLRSSPAPNTLAFQRWSLRSIKNTNYGNVNPNGVYDVCDYAEAHYIIPRNNDAPLPVTLAASWKEGYDDQSITIYYKDGSTYRWDYGLCPDDAYGEMIQAVYEDRFMDLEHDICFVEKELDRWIHEQLELFE